VYDVVCSKCGATGSSKHPHRRNVFPDDGDIALLSWMYPAWIADDDDGIKQMFIKVPLREDDETEEALIDRLLNVLQTMKDDGKQKKFLCDCDYDFVSEDDRKEANERVR